MSAINVSSVVPAPAVNARNPVVSRNMSPPTGNFVLVSVTAPAPESPVTAVTSSSASSIEKAKI